MGGKLSAGGKEKLSSSEFHPQGKYPVKMNAKQRKFQKQKWNSAQAQQT